MQLVSSFSVTSILSRYVFFSRNYGYSPTTGHVHSSFDQHNFLTMQATFNQQQNKGPTATQLRGQHLRWFKTWHRWTEEDEGFIKSSDICASNHPSGEDASGAEIDRILFKEQHVFKNMTILVCFHEHKYYQSKQDIQWGLRVEVKRLDRVKHPDHFFVVYMCSVLCEVFTKLEGDCPTWEKTLTSNSCSANPSTRPWKAASGSSLESLRMEEWGCCCSVEGAQEMVRKTMSKQSNNQQKDLDFQSLFWKTSDFHNKYEGFFVN